MPILFLNDINLSGVLTLLNGTGYLDLDKNEIRQAVVQALATEPSSPVAGQILFNTSKTDAVKGNGKFGYRTATSWVYPDMEKSVYDTNNNGKVDISENSEKLNGNLPDYYLNRTNHTGTQTASTISDFANAAKDAVGASLVDSNTIDFDYNATNKLTTANVKLATSGGLTSNSNGLLLTDTVTPGTYCKVTVDVKGRVTNGAPRITKSEIDDFDNEVKAVAATMGLSEFKSPTADVSFNDRRLTNLGSPQQATDAATKGYVDNLALGFDAKQSVRCATTANIANLSGGAPNVVDGVTLSANDRVLVKNQTTPAQNGIYVVQTVGSGSNGVWVRAQDMDSWEEVPAAYVFVEEGATQSDTGWLCTSDKGGTLGTTAINWVQFTGAGSVIAGVALQKAGNTLNVLYNSTSLLVDGSNQLDVKLKSNGGLAKDANGVYADVDNTTIVLNAGKLSVANTFQTRKYAATITGNGVATQFAVTHNFNTTDVIVQVFDGTMMETVYANVVRNSSNQVRIDFKTAPANNKQYRVVVIG